MRSFTSILAAAGLAQLALATCRPDFCKKAIQLQPFGIEDCNSFLLTTVVMPTETDYLTPSAVVTHTKTRTISETETDSKTESFQPSVVIWSTYTSVDVINSVTHTTTKKITTTSTTKYTKTTTTALSTTTSTTTTMTTTRAQLHPRSAGNPIVVSPASSGPQPTTIVPSQTPEYAGTCKHVSRYARNCLDLGATTSVTTIWPDVESKTISSTLLSYASADTSLIVSTTLTKTTTKTLPSLHSTATATRTTTTVISTSTSTTYTKTTTKTTTGIKTTTLGTTTTTTTLRTTSPTPYIMYVKSEDYSQGSSPDVATGWVDWITPGGQSALNGYPYSYALGFVYVASNADIIVVNRDGYLATVRQDYPRTGVNTQLLFTVVDGGYVVPNASPASDAELIKCSVSPSGGKAYLTDCTHNFYVSRWTASNDNSNTIAVMMATQDANPPQQLSFELTPVTYDY